MKSFLVAFFLLTFSSIASAKDNTVTALEYLNYAGIAADVATTKIALHNGAEEKNPIYGSHPNILILGGVGLLRASLVHWVANSDDLSDADKKLALTVSSVITFAVVGNNVGVIRHGKKLPYIIVGVSIPIGARLAF